MEFSVSELKNFHLCCWNMKMIQSLGKGGREGEREGGKVCLVGCIVVSSPKVGVFRRRIKNKRIDRIQFQSKECFFSLLFFLFRPNCRCVLCQQETMQKEKTTQQRKKEKKEKKERERERERRRATKTEHP